MDIDTAGDGTAHGKIVTVHLTDENWAEMPDRLKDAYHEAQSCSEILAVLTTFAIQLDRKQMEFQGALREATAKKEAEVKPLCPLRVCAVTQSCSSPRSPCRHKPDTLEHWQAVYDANFRATVATATALGHLDGDDNAFAGEVDLSELRSGKDRRNGDRRIFEATCLTANKRNLNREDRRQGERRKP